MPSGGLLAQAAGFPALVAITLFSAAGRIDLPLYWAYVAVLEALSISRFF
jgi:hypothetical protein